MDKSYKINRLEAENVKRLAAISVEPDGNIVEISGENGSGKTSCLDAIFWALAGQNAIQTSPIRKGAKEAFVRLSIGDLKVTRKFRDKEGGYTTSLRVETLDGATYSKPQEILNAIIGELTFDPMAFLDMSAKAQFEALRTFVPGVDFDEMDRLDEAAVEARRDLNRTAKSLRTQAEAIEVPAILPPEPVNADDAMAKFEAAAKHNALVSAIAQKHRSIADGIIRKNDHIDGLLRQVINLKTQFETDMAGLQDTIKQYEALIETQKAALKALPAIPDPIDIADVRREVEEIKSSAEAHKRLRARAELMAKATLTEENASGYTKDIERRRAEKTAAIAAAKMPVAGLSFADDKTILLNEIPIDQASRAEQIRGSVALAAAMNPALRICFVRDGSLLDQKSWTALCQIASELDFQIFVETVESGRPGAIVLEDGMVKQAERMTEEELLKGLEPLLADRGAA